MSRPRFSLLALAALTVVLAACGGGDRLSKPEYEQKLKGAGVELSNSSKSLAEATTGPEYVDGVQEAQNGLRKAADDLDSIDPPEDAAPANGRLVAALRGLADEFDKVKAAAANGPKAARAAGARLAQSQASETAREAVLEIQRRGYDVGRLSST
jgi:hypothetical protein